MHVALFAALTAALAVVPPVNTPVLGVPVTAQSLGPMLAGAVVGARRGALSQLLFLALVAAGLPLLAGGRGGLGVFLTPSAGYLLSWPLAALVTGALFQRSWEHLTVPSAAASTFVGGIVVVYAIGIPWAAVVTDLRLWQSAVAGLVFVPGDLVKVAAATAVAVTMRRSYPLITAPA